ncbi:serine hydrolase domain-containing protein [Streptomyces sp. MST-110588]|uniref:serine hydrolase domain-containing protein n=1 Tax=Streptomyces sp. MST-110588 TaxID=2833628 RepID=UPI001F5DFEE9|nr:serine hydrolase domain-containing protein [Streptomyces sp. MST-110588]UNO38386.1 beta-lactamase family protein [Streptomyces sp. MST-110588]
MAQRAVDNNSLGVIVRVDRGQGRPMEVVRQAAWTEADGRLAVGDQFRVGSNTKTVTATLVLQQVAEHRIGLEDPVEKWLPGLVPGGPDITVKMLLNHTSGLGDFALTPRFLPSLTGQDKRTWTPEELIALSPGRTSSGAPGKKYSYSNTNYEALGLILEKATGKKVADLIEQRITKPLGMKDTFLATDAAWSRGKKHVTGYEPGPGRLRSLLARIVDLPEGTEVAGPRRPHDNVDAGAVDPGWTWAAGGLVSTAPDWQRFQSALMSGTLLPAVQMKQMRQTVPDPQDGGGYGLGLMKVDTSCGTVWGHTGGLPGYSSEFYTDQSGRRSVAVLTATNFHIKEPTAAAANKDLVNAAICTMLDKPWPERTAPSAR